MVLPENLLHKSHTSFLKMKEKPQPTSHFLSEVQLMFYLGSKCEVIGVIPEGWEKDECLDPCRTGIAVRSALWCELRATSFFSP